MPIVYYRGTVEDGPLQVTVGGKTLTWLPRYAVYELQKGKVKQRFTDRFKRERLVLGKEWVLCKKTGGPPVSALNITPEEWDHCKLTAHDPKGLLTLDPPAMTLEEKRAEIVRLAAEIEAEEAKKPTRKAKSED